MSASTEGSLSPKRRIDWREVIDGTLVPEELCIKPGVIDGPKFLRWL